jgi:CRISPR-associated protein Cmr2
VALLRGFSPILWGAGVRVDLVLVALGGVQRFIAESRTTADVAGGSRLMQRLAWQAAQAARRELRGAAGEFGLIFPGAGATLAGTTNKIAFLAPEGAGPRVAGVVAGAVTRGWQEAAEAVFGTKGSATPATPGMPDVAWASVTGQVDAYRDLWEAAQRAMVARRRSRVFVPVRAERVVLCAQAPHLPAGPVPRRSRRHERGERLSAAGWVKRWEGRRGGEVFPSTLAIASATYRSALLAASPIRESLREPVRALAETVDRLDPQTGPGDPPEALAGWLERAAAWLDPQRWDPGGLALEYEASADLVAAGERQARRILELARSQGIRPPSPYYAVVVQDLDRLGRALGRLGLAGQREVSGQLTVLAAAQRDAVGAVAGGFPVYAGGDDLLAFCPAAAALPVAATVRRLVTEHLAGGPLGSAGPDGSVVTASTAVVFGHMTSPLRETLLAAREAIGLAKTATGRDGRSRDALAVLVRRRGGERTRLVQPWSPAGIGGPDAAELLARLRPAGEPVGLSGGLAAQLERDGPSLSELAGRDLATVQAEIARLVGRRGGGPAAAEALTLLGVAERVTGGGFDPVPAALIGRFLAQEC